MTVGEQEVARTRLLFHSDPEPIEILSAGLKIALAVSILLRLSFTEYALPPVQGGLVAALSHNAAWIACLLIVLAILRCGAVYHDKTRARLVLSILGSGWWLFSTFTAAALLGIDGRVGLYYVLLCANVWAGWRLTRPGWNPPHQRLAGER